MYPSPIVINKIMFSNNIEYKIYTFNDYNEELKKELIEPVIEEPKKDIMG